MESVTGVLIREFIRTPLGGFINHSETPNCQRSQIRIKPGLDKWNLLVIEDIEEGDELTSTSFDQLENK